MYLSRAIDEVLLRWERSGDRKPLVLRGARQTGKSSSVRELGRRFDLFLELNLERFTDQRLVRSCGSVEDLLTALKAHRNLRRFPERTLLFLDEIQEEPKAISWLRFLYEDHPDLYVIAAGSLMEVRLQERGFSFPVGRVTFRTLRPFTFLESLKATGRSVMVDSLVESLQERRPAPGPLHDEALGRLRDYLLVGGMPEAVSRWLETGSVAAARQVQADLVQALAEDVQKYKGVRDVGYLEAAFDNLKNHYGLRFRYESFAPGYRSQLMKTALAKLEAALLVTRVWPTSSLHAPLATRSRSAPKLLPLDVGLALHTMGTGYELLRSQSVDRLLDGRVAEIFAGQQLLAASVPAHEPLHFWVTESSTGNAEVDYLLLTPWGPLPVEVKAGAAGSLKSLHRFLSLGGHGLGIRLSAAPFADEALRVRMPKGMLHYRLLSVPLYLAESVPALRP